jgi:hypothetical protein
MRHITVLLTIASLILISCKSKIKNEDSFSFKVGFFSGLDTILKNNVSNINIKKNRVFFVDSSYYNIKSHAEFNKEILTKYFHKIDWESFRIFKRADTNFLFVILDTLSPIQNYERLVVLEKRFYPNIDIQPYFALHLISMRNDSFVSSFLLTDQILLNCLSITHGSILFSDTLLVRRNVEIITSDVQELKLMKSSNYSTKKITTEIFSFNKENGLFTLLSRYNDTNTNR